MEKNLEMDYIDIDFVLKQEITNVICMEANEPDLDLFAQAFYDIYIKS